MTAAVRRAAGRTFRSMHVRNYRLYFFGQIVSITGTWMMSVAQIWLVLRLTNSALAVALTGSFQFLPVLLLGAWGGLIADRFDKRKLLIGTQSVRAVLSLALAIITVTGLVHLWMIYAIALAVGLTTVIDNPTRQAFAMEMVGPEDVTNAVSLNSATFTGSRIVGPAVAGVVIAVVGIAACFFIDAISYIAVIVALVMIRPKELFRQAPQPRAKGQLREGFRYVWRSPDLRFLLLLAAVIYTFSFNFSVILSLLVKWSFGGGAGEYGILLSVMGVGSLIGALVMAGRARPSRLMIPLSGIAFGALEAAAALMPSIGFVMGLFVPLGFASMILMASTNTSLQLASNSAMRGRVMGLYAVVFLGSTPIGNPLAGWFADTLGPRGALAIAGGVAVAASFVALLYVRRLGRSQTAAEEPLDEEISVEQDGVPGRLTARAR